LAFFFLLSFIENKKIKNKLFAFFILMSYGFSIGYNIDQSYSDADKKTLIPIYYLGSIIIGLVLPTFLSKIKFPLLNLKLGYNTSIICFTALTIGYFLNLTVFFILLSFSSKYLGREIVSTLYGFFNGLLFTVIIDGKIIKFDFSFYEKLLALIIYFTSTFIGIAFQFSSVSLFL